MADISKIKTLDGTTYDIKDAVARSYHEPIETKTYTNIIATANDNNGAGFFYLKYRGETYNSNWHIKTRVIATIPDQTGYYTDSIFDLYGFANTYSFYSCFNWIRSTSYRPIYYNSNFRVSETGYNNGCGGWIGFNLWYSTNNTNASYKRTIEVQLLEYENCTVELQDTLITPTDIPERATHTNYYNSTNTNYDNFDAYNYGLKQTGDANTTSITNLYFNNAYYIAKSAIYRYQLLFQIDENTLTPLNNDNNVVDTTKTMLTDVEFDPFGKIFYYNSTTIVAANGNIAGNTYFWAFNGINLRYTLNCGQTLTAHKPIYLVVTPTSNGKCKIANVTPWAQSLPISQDGNWYILLGRAYSTYQIVLYPQHPIYYHDGTKVREVLPNNDYKLDKNAELLTTNPFAPKSVQGPYISKIDNAFYAADKRWNVTMTNIGGSLAYLFDGNYDAQVQITNGQTSILTIDFSTESNGYFPGYPYGYILVSFYYRAAPANVSGRVYCNYESQGIGWHDISFSPLDDNTTTAIIYRSAHQSYYNISKLEITIVGDTTNADGKTSVTQVEMHLDRPYSGRNPFLSKYSAETLYYPLTAPSFVGDLTGNASTATNASKVNNHTVESDVPVNAKFTDTTYEIATSSAAGLLSAEDKTKIDNLEQTFESITTDPAPIVTFNANAANMPIKSITVQIEPMQAGIGDPSAENIRPIGGWTGAKINGTNINIWNEQWESGSISNETGQDIANSNVIRTKGYISVKPGTVYAMVKSASSVHGIAFYDANKAFVSYRILGSSELYVRFAPPDNCYYVRFRCVNAYGTTYKNDISINYPSTDTAYHAYKGKEISITFPSAAGTVYGSILTVNSDRTGSLVVDRAVVTLDGTNSTYTTSSGYPYARYQLSPNYGDWDRRQGLLSNKYSARSGGANVDKAMRLTGNISNPKSESLFIYDSDFTDEATMKQILNESPVQVSYYLYTPITYNLTASEIDGILMTVYGTNNIWADTGDVTVSYGAYLETIKTYADQLGDSILSAIAPLETTYTASRAYTAGSYLFVGTKFYKVTAAIAEGGTITPDTNVTQTTIAEQLMALAAN